MFSLVSGIYDSYLAPSQLNLLVVGAPDSGKTTLLERLKVTEIPTRSRNGSGGYETFHQRISAEEIPATLEAALIETGALEGQHHGTPRPGRRSLSKNSLASRSGGSMASGGGVAVATSSYVPLQALSVASSKVDATPSKTVTISGNALVVTQKKRFSYCPAPKRYSRSAQDQDEEIVDDEDEETEQLLLGGGDSESQTGSPSKIGSQDAISGNRISPVNPTRDTPRHVRSHSKEFGVGDLDLMTDGMDAMQFVTPNNDKETSMQSIGLGNPAKHNMSMRSLGLDQSIGIDDDYPISIVTNKALQPPTPPPPPLPRPFPLQNQKPQNTGPPLLQSSQEERNLKRDRKMLPLRMIRPTIGTNLAKIDMYGAKCHIFDVGGRLQDLWKRYYGDCDAVIFCWKLGEDPDKPPVEPDSDDDSDAEEEDIRETIYKKQLKLLNTVRNSIPDDVPFLILGHVFGSANSQIVDTMYTTDLLLPRYHNPMTGFCCSSAKTGAGVQSAMEWLIPLAKRQQKERMASKRELDMMLEEQGKIL